MSEPRTLNELFFGALDRFGHKPVFMRVKRDGAWREISYATALHQIQCIAAGLRELKVDPGSRVALLSENRPEWAMVDYACLSIRCAEMKSRFSGLRPHPLRLGHRMSCRPACICKATRRLPPI